MKTYFYLLIFFVMAITWVLIDKILGHTTEMDHMLIMCAFCTWAVERGEAKSK